MKIVKRVEFFILTNFFYKNFNKKIPSLQRQGQIL